VSFSTPTPGGFPERAGALAGTSASPYNWPIQNGEDAMSPETFLRSAVAIGISVAAMWTVTDIVGALVALPAAAGLDWATRRRRDLAGF
jgi:hypothetical protein